ncbi:hypothetical protein Tco_0330908 [Tanacetum coccineum]
MHLKRQIEEMLKTGKLSHLIKGERKQWKRTKQGGKEGRKPQEGKATSNPDAEVGGQLVHRMYVDGGASSEILCEHCFNQLYLEIRKQMVPVTTYLVGFSGEIIWSLGQVSLLVKIGDEEHSTSAWMNFMVVSRILRYNGNKETSVEGDQSNPVHSSRNAKIPGDRRNGHSAK